MLLSIFHVPLTFAKCRSKIRHYLAFKIIVSLQFYSLYPSLLGGNRHSVVGVSFPQACLKFLLARMNPK